MITCDQISVSYGSTIAADRVSFEVAPGEVFGLLGPNGAGKTSVIRALTTIIEPDAGTARIDGIALRDAAGIRTRIGVLPESSGYPGTRSGREVLEFQARLFGSTSGDASDRAVELLSRVGLAEHGDQFVSSYSRGMRQRLGIARSLVSRPRALFLDEPTLGLDPAGKNEILQFLRSEAAETGGAVVLCSHLLDEVERVCDRVAIMHEARVIVAGTVGDVVGAAQVLSGARLDVAPRDVGWAVDVINTRPGYRATPGDGTAGRIDVDFKPDGPTLVDLAGVLSTYDLSFTSLEARGARLSDAFLQLTGATDGLVST